MAANIIVLYFLKCFYYNNFERVVKIAEENRRRDYNTEHCVDLKYVPVKQQSNLFSHIVLRPGC